MGGPAVDGFYAKEGYLDEVGKLCVGTIVDPKRFKKRKRLKQHLATKTEILKYIQGLSAI